LAFLHRHNGLAILISQESCTPCHARTPHVVVVSRDTSPRTRLFSFPRASPPFLARGRRRSIATSFCCSDVRLGDPSPPPLLPSCDATPARRSIAASFCCNDVRLGDRSQRRDRISTTWTKRRRGLAGRHGRSTRETIGGDGRRNCARRARKFPAKMKDSRTKIVGSTILGNASQNCQTLGDKLIFSLAKRLGTWQTPTNGKFQLHNCWRCPKRTGRMR